GDALRVFEEMRREGSNGHGSHGTEPDTVAITSVICSASEFLVKPIQKREPVIKDILYEQTFGTLWGWRGLGKTELIISMAAEIATGGQWLYWPVLKPCKVLYIDGELPADYLHWTLNNWLAGRDGANIDVLGSDDFYRKFNRKLNLNLQQDQDM